MKCRTHNNQPPPAQTPLCPPIKVQEAIAGTHLAQQQQQQAVHGAFAQCETVERCGGLELSRASQFLPPPDDEEEGSSSSNNNKQAVA